MIDLHTEEDICKIEDAYIAALGHGNMEGEVTYGELVDALEAYLKEVENN